MRTYKGIQYQIYFHKSGAVFVKVDGEIMTSVNWTVIDAMNEFRASVDDIQ